MSNNELLTIEPMHLVFHHIVKSKAAYCCLYLTNKTENDVAFKVKSTFTENFSVRPSTGVILGRSSCKVLVTRKSEKEAPGQISESFLIQSVKAGPGITANELTREMFNKEAGHIVEATKLTVTFVNFDGTTIIGRTRIKRRLASDMM